MWMSHVTHANEPCHTCEWAMSHMWMSHEFNLSYTSQVAMQQLSRVAVHSRATVRQYGMNCITRLVVAALSRQAQHGAKNNVCVHIYIYIHICICIYMYVYIYIWVCSYIYIHVYIHICIYTYTCIHKHRCTYWHPLSHSYVYIYAYCICAPFFALICIDMYTCVYLAPYLKIIVPHLPTYWYHICQPISTTSANLLVPHLPTY